MRRECVWAHMRSPVRSTSCPRIHGWLDRGRLDRRRLGCGRLGRVRLSHGGFGRMRLGRGWLGQRPLQSQMSSHYPHTGTRIINYSFSSTCTAARGTVDGLLPPRPVQPVLRPLLQKVDRRHHFLRPRTVLRANARGGRRYGDQRHTEARRDNAWVGVGGIAHRRTGGRHR